MTVRDEAAQPLAGRAIAASVAIDVVEGRLRIDGEAEGLPTVAYPVDAISHDRDAVVATFAGAAGVFQMRLRLPAPQPGANGVAALLRLSGWSDIRYLAIGYSAGAIFRHVKIAHVVQDVWLPFAMAPGDLAFRIQNGWTIPQDGAIDDVRLYVKGAPGANGATIAVSKAWVFEDAGVDATLPVESAAGA